MMGVESEASKTVQLQAAEVISLFQNLCYELLTRSWMFLSNLLVVGDVVCTTQYIFSVCIQYLGAGGG